MSTETETQEVESKINRGGRPKNPPAPTNSAEVRSLMASEVVRAAPDKDRLRFLGELLISFEGVEARAETAASKLLPAITEERDTLLARVNELQPLAEQLPTVAQELADLRTNFDSKITEARKAFFEDAQQCQWKAERAENAAAEKLQEAQRQFGQTGLQLLLDEMKKIVEASQVPEPDPATLPNGISPLFLTCWGNTPIRAQLLLSFAKSFPEPSENYTRTLVRCLKAQLPVYEGAPPSDPIEHLQDKIDVLRSLGKKWPGVLEEVNRQVEEAQVQRQANFLREHYAQMQSQSNDAALRGEGRTSIVPEVPVSSVPLSEHLPGCVGPCCSPGLRQRGSLEALDGVENF